MSLGQVVHRGIRSLLERRGYWTRHRSVLPFGIDYQHDIVRLCNIYGGTVYRFFDIGANIGQTSTAALASFPDATVFAFEPDKSAFDALSRNVRDARLQPFNLALSDKSGETRFFDYGAGATSNSLIENSQYAMRTHHSVTIRSVRCETLDAFCNSHGVDKIDVLKIDTEGHEMAVLQGAATMLAGKRVRFVYVEFNTLLPKVGSTGGALLPISEVLEPLGYHFVATYADFMITTGDFFVTSNALFVCNAY